MTSLRTLDRAKPRRLGELYPVSAVRDIQSGERMIPRGATGTIVLVHGDFEAYEVEFTRPFHAIVCVSPGDLARHEHELRRP